MVIKKYFILITFLSSLFNYAAADNDGSELSTAVKSLILVNHVTNKISCVPELHCHSSHTAAFYKNNNYKIIWSSDGHILPQTQKMLALLKNATDNGLNPKDYHLQQLNDIYTTINDSSSTDQSINIAMFDMVLTDGAFLYLHDLSYGHTDYKKNYPNWSYQHRDINIDNVLSDYLQSDDENAMFSSVLPSTKLYYDLRDQLIKYQNIVVNGGFPIISNGTILKIGSRGVRVKSLQQRLILSAELLNTENLKYGIFDKRLKKAVLQFQINNGIKPTGVVDRHTLNILNISADDRVETIAKNLDRMRMMSIDTNAETILVNIPDYHLTMWSNESPIFSMMAIVGDKKHRSCVLNSKVSYLEINPYWNIPRSIAIKELLPKIIKDNHYLAQKNIDTFLIESTNHIQIDPSTVEWKKVDVKNFNYFFRQNPGSDNALGHIKFIFPNNCGIYLHDTDEPNLFGRKKRDLSHGCIRISQPIKLATYLLQDKRNWSESAIESAIFSGKRRVVTLTKPENVVITYMTSWVNESGVLQFRPDIYDLDRESTIPDIQHSKN